MVSRHHLCSQGSVDVEARRKVEGSWREAGRNSSKLAPKGKLGLLMMQRSLNSFIRHIHLHRNTNLPLPQVNMYLPLNNVKCIFDKR